MLDQIQQIVNSPDLTKAFEAMYASLIEKGFTGPAIQAVVGEATDNLFE